LPPDFGLNFSTAPTGGVLVGAEVVGSLVGSVGAEVERVGVGMSADDELASPEQPDSSSVHTVTAPATDVASVPGLCLV